MLRTWPTMVTCVMVELSTLKSAPAYASSESRSCFIVAGRRDSSWYDWMVSCQQACNLRRDGGSVVTCLASATLASLLRAGKETALVLTTTTTTTTTTTEA